MNNPESLKKLRYIVAEIPEQPGQLITKIRKDYDPLTSTLPVEITLAGSSGVGPILEEVPLNNIISIVDAICLESSPFDARFNQILSFPNTSIYYLEPIPRRPFDVLHQKFKNSSIEFSDSPFPYNPHCTLRAIGEISPNDVEKLIKTPVPTDTFTITQLSVYEVTINNDGKFVGCSQLHSHELGE